MSAIHYSNNTSISLFNARVVRYRSIQHIQQNDKYKISVKCNIDIKISEILVKF